MSDTNSAPANGFAPNVPVLAVVSAFGLIVVAVADVAGRFSSPLAVPLFFAGILTLFIPGFCAMLAPRLSRTDAAWITLLIGVGLYAVKVLRDPVSFTEFDEFLHWRSALDLAATGHLFTKNPLLPVSPLYPGLEIITNALMKIGNQPVFPAGILVVGVARTVQVLALFLLYERLSGSVRIAGIGSAVYMANPNFLSFDAQYAYESLALPLAVFCLYLVALGQVQTGKRRWVVNFLAALTLIAVAGTHHISSYLLMGMLVVWGGLSFIYRQKRWEALPSIFWVVVLVVAANSVWLLTVASLTIGYLAPAVEGTVTELLKIIAGEGGGRRLFQPVIGEPAPLLERLIGLGSTAFTLLGMPVGFWLFWTRYRHSSLASMLFLVACTYPVTLALHFTTSGWEIGARASAYLWIGLAFLVALGIAQFVTWVKIPSLRIAILGPLVALVYAGGVVAGTSPYTRTPGPYAVGAESRSIERQGIAAAEWTRIHLGPYNRMAADRTNMCLMGTYGEQRLVTHPADGVSISGLFLSPDIDESELETIKKAKIRYLVEDQRLSTSLPLVGNYYETWERMVVPYSGPPPSEVLAKYDKVPGVDRIFDSGDIAIYDVRALANAQTDPR
jgi:hypothetical protein